jgi:hypothetical protein
VRDAGSFIDPALPVAHPSKWASSGLTIDPDPGKYPGADWRVECKRQLRCHAEFGN